MPAYRVAMSNSEKLQRGHHTEAVVRRGSGVEQLGLCSASSARWCRHRSRSPRRRRGSRPGQRAAVPAEPAAEAVAGDADVGGGAVQGGAVRAPAPPSRPVPDRAAAHPGDPPDRVDADLGQSRQPGQHDVVQAALSQRSGVASGGLGATRRPCSAARRTSRDTSWATAVRRRRRGAGRRPGSRPAGPRRTGSPGRWTSKRRRGSSPVTLGRSRRASGRPAVRSMVTVEILRKMTDTVGDAPASGCARRQSASGRVLITEGKGVRLADRRYRPAVSSG